MWLIDRTWKPAEGWSRPALTVEDNQHHHDEAGKPPAAITGRHEHQVPHSRPRSGSRTATRRQDNRFCGRPWPRGDARSHSNPEAKPWPRRWYYARETWEKVAHRRNHTSPKARGTHVPRAFPVSRAQRQNPRHGHRRTGGAYHTARSSSHEHPSKPEEQQLPTIFSQPTCLSWGHFIPCRVILLLLIICTAPLLAHLGRLADDFVRSEIYSRLNRGLTQARSECGKCVQKMI